MDPRFPHPAPAEDMDALHSALDDALVLAERGEWWPTDDDVGAVVSVAAVVECSAVGTRWRR